MKKCKELGNCYCFKEYSVNKNLILFVEYIFIIGKVITNEGDLFFRCYSFTYRLYQDEISISEYLVTYDRVHVLANTEHFTKEKITIEEFLKSVEKYKDRKEYEKDLTYLISRVEKFEDKIRRRKIV